MLSMDNIRQFHRESPISYHTVSKPMPENLSGRFVNIDVYIICYVDVGRLMDNMGRENLIIAVMASIFLFALIFGGSDARKLDRRRPTFPSRSSVARAKAFLDENPVVDGFVSRVGPGVSDHWKPSISDVHAILSGTTISLSGSGSCSRTTSPPSTSTRTCRPPSRGPPTPTTTPTSRGSGRAGWAGR